MKETTTKTRRDGLLPYRLANPSLTQLAYVVVSRPGRVIPKTIIIINNQGCKTPTKYILGMDTLCNNVIYSKIIHSRLTFKGRGIHF